MLVLVSVVDGGRKRKCGVFVKGRRMGRGQDPPGDRPGSTWVGLRCPAEGRREHAPIWGQRQQQKAAPTCTGTKGNVPLLPARTLLFCWGYPTSKHKIDPNTFFLKSAAKTLSYP